MVPMNETIVSEFDVLPLVADEPIETEGTITQPFDPTKIRVETKQLSLDTLISRMKHGEIILQPDFQRQEVWRDQARSRLIESILIRIPLPAFYMDATDDDRWLVVDGQQRLSTLRRFVIDENLKLDGLEFLKELKGCGFEGLSAPLQRRIRETNVTVYLIERGTPSAVKINIFKRINTGGLPLSAQEIRHALNGQPVGNLLKKLAESEVFQTATNHGVPSERMANREYVVRFFAFLLTKAEDYSSQEFDSFLSDTMARINKLEQSQLDDLEGRFARAMIACNEILGKLAFRKVFDLEPGERLRPVNKALFEAWSVNLDSLSDGEIKVLSDRRRTLLEHFVALMQKRDFEQSISQGTGDVAKVRLRFSAIGQIIRETLA